MNKKLLRQVPIRGTATKDVKVANKYSKEVRYLMSVEKLIIDNKNMLVLYFYESINKASFRTFLDKEDYITQDLTTDKIKWKTGALEKLLDINWYGSGWERVSILDNKSKKNLKEYLGVNKNYFEEIQKVQRIIMESRLSLKHRKITDVIDKEMEIVPELPVDFSKWIEEVAFYKSKYIYYEYKANKKMYGYCTGCKRIVEILNPKHNKKDICINCNSNITYKVLGKSKRVRDYGHASIIQKVGEVIIIREFSITKTYDLEYRNPRVTYHELIRRIYKDYKERTYEYAEFRQSGKHRWCDYEMKIYSADGALYDNNLKILNETKWKYSAIKELATSEPGYLINTNSYLRAYEENPVIEKLVKFKLYNLAKSMCVNVHETKKIINENGKRFNEIIKLNKSYLHLLQKLNVNLNELKLIQESLKLGMRLTENQIIYISINDFYWDILLKLTKYANINKILKYLEGQVNKEFVAKYVLTDWRDYICDCEKLKYNLKNEFILFPKDLKSQHEITSNFLIDKEDKKNDKVIKKINKEINYKYLYENKDYKIIAPCKASSIIKEGQELKHCVGRYIDRIVNRETIVLFVREKEDLNKSFYTIEITKEKIIQCRGLQNKSYEGDEKLDKFIKQFNKKILIPLRNEKQEKNISA